MKEPFFSQLESIAEVTDKLNCTGNLFGRLTNEDFKFLLTLFTIYPQVAEAFFKSTLRPLAAKTAKELNEAYPLIHITAQEVASMVLACCVNENFASLQAWTEMCRFQRWVNIVYPQRCKEALRQMGIMTKPSRGAQKSLRLKLLSFTIEERIFIIEHLDDERMVCLLTAIYVDRLSPEEIEEQMGMDVEEQEKTHKAAARCLRNIVDEQRGAIYFSRNGIVVNLAAKLFPTNYKNEELAISEMVRIDNNENFDIVDDNDGDDELSEFLRELYPHLNTRAACNQFVSDCANEAKLTIKEAFIWKGRMDNLSSTEIAERYMAFRGKKIANHNVDNAVKVAKKKITAIIEKTRDEFRCNVVR